MANSGSSYRGDYADRKNDICLHEPLEEEMMGTITFTVPGIPRGQARHRTFFGRGIRREVDPSAALKDDFLKIAYEHKPDVPMTKPLVLTVRFRFPRPKAHFTKKGLRPTAPFAHSSRPDIDNLVKFVQDSLNGVFFKDDSQIYGIMAQKIYSDHPETWVHLEELEEGAILHE